MDTYRAATAQKQPSFAAPAKPTWASSRHSLSSTGRSDSAAHRPWHPADPAPDGTDSDDSASRGCTCAWPSPSWQSFAAPLLPTHSNRCCCCCCCREPQGTPHYRLSWRQRKCPSKCPPRQHCHHFQRCCLRTPEMGNCYLNKKSITNYITNYFYVTAFNKFII